MNRPYHDAIVIITGGASGMGKQLALQLAGQGAAIYIADINDSAGEQLAADIRTGGGRADYCHLDVREPMAVTAYIERIASQAGRLDYVFQCTGTIIAGEFRDTPLSDLEDMYLTDVQGTLRVAHAAYRIMAKQGFGHLILFSSGGGLFPLPAMIAYSSTKAAVFMLADGLRLEGRALGVRVSAVTPGLVDTPLYDAAVYSRTDKAKALDLLRDKGHMQSPERAARIILKGVRKNKAVINTWAAVHTTWWLYRLVPWLYRRGAGLAMKPFRQHYRRPD